MEILLVLIILLALGIAFFLRRSGRAARSTGRSARKSACRLFRYRCLGAGRETLVLAQIKSLTGKPDYIVQDESGAMIPIEVKPTRTASEPAHMRHYAVDGIWNFGRTRIWHAA